MNKLLEKEIIGVWSLVSYEATDSEGQIYYPMGKDAVGLIMYHPDGYVSAQIMKKGRPVYKSGDIHTGTQEEMALAANGYLAYCGTYRISKERAVLIHEMDISLNPCWLGNAQMRYIKILGNKVEIISEPVLINGVKQQSRLVWERIESGK